VEGRVMLAILRQKLRENGNQMAFYLGTHGMTMLLLIALLLGVILLD
jgi:hypothetical protein